MPLPEPIEWIPSRRRRAIRRSVLMPCEVVTEAGFRRVGERMLDLSPEGLFLATSDRVRIGEEVYVAFRAPSACGWIDAVGEVTRVVRGRRDTDVAPGIGIELVSMSDRDRARLRAELRGLPPPVPARRPRRDYALTVRRIVASRITSG